MNAGFKKGEILVAKWTLISIRYRISRLPKRRKVDVLLKKIVKTAMKNGVFDGVKVHYCVQREDERVVLR
jgi:hypothetical protein